MDGGSEQAGGYPQVLRIRTHTFRPDVGPEAGGTDSAPGPHDYFDAELAACKAQTAIWYAKRHDIPLERVSSHVERDDSEERKGKYRLRVRMEFHGPLSDEQRAALARAAGACPVHMRMTRTGIEIGTLARERHVTARRDARAGPSCARIASARRACVDSRRVRRREPCSIC